MDKCDTVFEDLVKLKLLSAQDFKTKQEEIYPKIVKFLRSENSIFEKTEVLGILFCSFVHHIEPRLYIENFSLVTTCMKSLLESSLKADLSDIHSTIAHLDNVVRVVEYFTTCIQNFTSAQKYVLEFALAGFALIKKSYQHCSKCSDIYGEILDDVKGKLQELVTQSHNLQVKLLLYLGQIQMNNSENLQQNPDLLFATLDALFEVLQPLAETMEIKATIPIWKAYTKCLFQFQDVLACTGQLDISNVLKILCSEIMKMLNSIGQNDAGSSLKLCTFLFKLLISFCSKLSRNMNSSFADILDLSLTLLIVSPPNLSSKMDQKLSEEYKRTLLIGLNPLVEQLIDEEIFATTLLRYKPNNNDDALAFCLFCIIVLDMLPLSESTVVELYFFKRESSIVARIFETLPLCSDACLLPIYLDGVMCRGKPQHSVSLYHFVCVHLCSFISSLSSSLFAMVETCILSYVLGTNPLRALLASDIFCFVARFATSELCYSHCLAFARVVNMSSEISVTSVHASSLLRRLFAFLNPAHQKNLLSEFPSLFITNLLDAHRLKPRMVLTTDDSEMTDFMNLSGNLEKLEAKAKTYQVLSKGDMEMVFKVVGAASSCNQPDFTELVFNKISRILLIAKDMKFEVLLPLAECVRKCASEGVQSAYLVLDSIFQNRIRNELPLSQETIQLLSQCLALGLNSSNILLQEMAFERFALISHPVVNEQLVRQTIKLCSQNLSIAFKEYMRLFILRKHVLDPVNKLELVRFILKPPKMEPMECGDLMPIQFLKTNLLMECGHIELDNEVCPPAKKPKSREQVSLALSSLYKAVQDLEEACLDSEMEDSHADSIKDCIKKLNRLFKT